VDYDINTPKARLVSLLRKGEHRLQCLTVFVNKYINSTWNAVDNANELLKSIQKEEKIFQVGMAPCPNDTNDSVQSFMAVRGKTDGQRHRSTAGTIIWAMSNKLCVTRSADVHVDAQPKVASDETKVTLCQSRHSHTI